MKNLLLIIFVLLSYNVNFSQTKKDSIIYRKPPFWSMKLGFDFVGYSGAEVQLSYYFREKYSVNLVAWQVFRNSKNTPSDYRNESLFVSTTQIGEELKSIGMLGGYLIEISETRGRFQLQAGLFINKLEFPDNFVKLNPPQESLFGYKNYTYEMIEEYYPSLVIAPVIEFPIWNHFGMSISPKLLISLKEVNFMMNISMNIGNATSRIKPKKRKQKY